MALFDAFQRFLIEQYGLGKSVLLIIDEAQNLSPDALESLRMLSNINADKHQLLQIMLVGQPQLKELLMRPDLSQFAQRVEVDFHIKPFAAVDVENYIEHRLAIAGRSTPLFTTEACAKIAEASQGVPRRINILCNTALVYGFSSEAKLIDLDIVEEVLSDRLHIRDVHLRENGKPGIGHVSQIIFDAILCPIAINGSSIYRKLSSAQINAAIIFKGKLWRIPKLAIETGFVTRKSCCHR